MQRKIKHKKLENQRILAIDPGTRYWGIAIFRDNDLCDSMVKVLKTKGSPRKRLEEVKKIFLSLLNDYAPDILVLEKPFFFWSKQSRFLDAVVEEVKSLAKKNKMKVYEYSPRTARKVVCGNGNASKKETAKLLATFYPDLYIWLNQDRKYKELYWGHMFDAVGLGVCYLKKIKEQS
ncbi:MAG: crossover junction endodeoxyribonuclease RuvC [Candidatus Ratteibacteria bacterium]|jgi:Holliday junction resolvasome RuvABC endonuclease subunit